MRQRVISAVILALLLFPPLILGGGYVRVLGVVIAMMIFYEIMKMRKLDMKMGAILMSYILLFIYILGPDIFSQISYISDKNVIILAIVLLATNLIFSRKHVNFDDISIMLFSIIYIGNAIQALIYVRDFQLYAIIYILFIVFSTDIGALLVGKRFGKKKLAPRISPNKTVEGFIGGIISALIVSFLYLELLPIDRIFYPNFLIVILLSIAGQFGDLVESSIKRHYNVKDSGKIIPGHGGMFDRFDSLLFVLNVVRLLLDFGIFSF